jgi:hypothetical protein
MTEILNLVVIFLLIVAIIYGFILNRKIVLIQNSKKELANLFKSFDNTILKAQIGIDDLKKVSNEISHLLQTKMDKATFIIDDLSFLTEKATQTSINMEKLVSATRKTAALVDEKVYSAERIKKMKEEFVIKPELNKNIITTEVQTKRARVLEGLLEKISEKRSGGSKERISNDNKNALNNNKDDEKLVADMLKAFGYGDS